MSNTYKYFAPNVYLAKCAEKHERGEIIPVETKNGKVNDSIVFNLIYERDGFFYYSIVRADGFNAQVRAQNKANKYKGWAISATNLSTSFYNKANEAGKYLTGEPVKLDHHSANRHLRDLEKVDNYMRKSVEVQNKVEPHLQKAENWSARTEDVNLSMPESIAFYTEKLEIAQALHKGLKDGTISKRHSFDMSYANRDVKKAKENLELAKKLWQ